MTDLLLELEGSLPRIAPAREARQLGAILDDCACTHRIGGGTP